MLYVWRIKAKNDLDVEILFIAITYNSFGFNKGRVVCQIMQRRKNEIGSIMVSD